MLAHPDLTTRDKKTVVEKNTKDGKISCMIDGHLIRKKKDIEFHHIKPYLFEEKLDISNIAVVCKKHHREIGYFSINEYCALKEMETFFKSGGIKRLDDILRFKNNNAEENEELEFELDEEKDIIKIMFREALEELVLPLYSCPSTGFKFFYAVIPRHYIHNDLELQPRPLELKRLWELYRHLIVNTQLTPSICRLVGKKIFLFDGQHKAAAQIWAERNAIECKIYIEPVIKILKETNLVAHDKLRQMPFFASVLINKWASIFSEEWNEYMESSGNKSEDGFINFLVSKGKKKSEAVHMLQSNIYDSILEDSGNRIRKYLEEYGDGFKKPLTVLRLKQSILKRFIADKPLSIDIEESDRLREIERQNLLRSLNLITAYTLDGKWSIQLDDENHKTAERIFLGGSFKAWTAVLKDIVANVLELYDENERKEILLREITDEQWQLIEDGIKKLFSHRVWADDSQENYNNLRMGNENLVRKYLARRGLNANWIINTIFGSSNNFID